MDILKWASEHGVLAVIIALLGWGVLTMYSKRLQKKTSVEAMEGKVEDMLSSFFSKSHDYWMKKNASQSEKFNYVAEVVNLIDCVEEKASDICAKVDSFYYGPYVEEFYDEILSIISNLRDSATMNAEKIEDTDSLLIQKKLLLIAKDSAKLRRKIREVVGKKYGEASYSKKE